MILTSLDNIPDSVLDKLVELYASDPKYRIVDERLKISFDKPAEYFLLEKKGSIEITFIWIHNNLWQYRYLNESCSSTANWKDPLQLLNELLNNSQTKEDIITQIKDIIKTFGEFSTSDVEASSDPCINSNSYGNIIELADYFGKEYVQTTTYDNSLELHTDNILYENLDYDVLLEILKLANYWKELNIEENE